MNWFWGWRHVDQKDFSLFYAKGGVYVTISSKIIALIGSRLKYLTIWIRTIHFRFSYITKVPKIRNFTSAKELLQGFKPFSIAWRTSEWKALKCPKGNCFAKYSNRCNCLSLTNFSSTYGNCKSHPHQL